MAVFFFNELGDLSSLPQAFKNLEQLSHHSQQIRTTHSCSHYPKPYLDPGQNKKLETRSICSMVGKIRKNILAFIEDIPDAKLEGGLPSRKTTIWQDNEYRLDMQTLTTNAFRCWNLQVQVNKGISITSARAAGEGGASVAMFPLPIDLPYSAAGIREKLTESAIDFGNRTGQF
jgi:hypothetical protein